METLKGKSDNRAQMRLFITNNKWLNSKQVNNAKCFKINQQT